MMEIMKYVATGVIAVVVSLALATLLGSSGSGGVGVLGAYSATTSSATTANTHKVVRNVVGGSSCELGSVVVGSSSPTTFTVYDATGESSTATNTLTTLAADVPEGTYTFDVECSEGLVIETPAGFDGEYTTTFR